MTRLWVEAVAAAAEAEEAADAADGDNPVVEEDDCATAQEIPRERRVASLRTSIEIVGELLLE